MTGNIVTMLINP